MLSYTRKPDGGQISQWSSCIKWRSLECVYYDGNVLSSSQERTCI